MPPLSVRPLLLAALMLSAPLVPASAAPRVDARAKAWVAGIVNRIGTADRAAAPGRGGQVTVRVRIEADGALGGIVLEEGPAVLGERAARAVEAAAPFPPPPAGLLTLEGFTELSFPLTLR
ncbi:MULTISPECIES: TonB family protein [Methylorubrum]|uniref:TonB family protein n=1 Tax=Methylorubrum TaxID=2282523 RepID=UPI0020A1A653|nr:MULTISPECIES: TonB family protein [Methylorubrum]MCP1546967.1 TonB family protein [Methylorubrum zatmanii]MCP1551754.1 TonB family protein [Methylorubrum extorquens]MCP1577270.1 TonB family protein [Methylorubrum extorquens]